MTAAKAHAAAVGGGVGAALATMIMRLLEARGTYLGDDFELALGVVITAAVGWLATYLGPANKPKP